MKIFKTMFLWLKDRLVRVEVPDHERISASILQMAEEEGAEGKGKRKARKNKGRKTNS